MEGLEKKLESHDDENMGESCKKTWRVLINNGRVTAKDVRVMIKTWESHDKKWKSHEKK